MYMFFMKIAGIVGKFIKFNSVISEKEFFSFSRVMVEVLIKKEYSECIELFDKWGYKVL